jgi:iron(III) transport system permease protein
MLRALGILWALPLAGFALEALLGAGAYRLPAREWLHSAAIASGATLTAAALGLPAGFALARTRSAWPRALTLLPPLLPPVIVAAAWSGAGLPAPGAAGCAFLLGLLYWPIPALAVEAGLRRLPAAALDAASLQLSRRAILRHVVWPPLRPLVAGALLLTFALAASEFTLPATFVLPAIPMRVYEELSAFRHASAAAASLPLLVLVGAVALRLRRLPELPAPAAPARLPGGAPAAAAGIGLALAWTLSLGVPFAVFGRDALRAAAPVDVRTCLEALAWGAAAAGTVAVALTAWSWGAAGRRSRLEPLWLALLVLPGVVAGFGLLAPLGRAGVVAPEGSLFLLSLASRLAFVAWLPLRGTVEPAQLEAAALAGLPPVRTWWRIVRPATAPRALVAAALVFVLAFGELGPSVLLAPPGRQTLVHHVFNWMHYGYDGAVASACLLTAATGAAGAWMIGYASRRAGSGTDLAR